MPNEMGPQMCFQLKATKVAPSSFSSKVCRLVLSSNQTAGPIFKVDLRLEISETWQLYKVAIVKEDYRDLYEVAGSASLLTRRMLIGPLMLCSAENASDVFMFLLKVKKFPWNLKRLQLVWRHFEISLPHLRSSSAVALLRGTVTAWEGSSRFFFFPFTPLAPVCLWSSWNLRLIDI